MADTADPVSLAGQVALVTGAARGIGRAVALRLARHGAATVLTDLADSMEELEGTQRQVEEEGGRAQCVAADLSRRADVDGVVSQALAGFGQVDVLANVAGIHLYPAPLLDMAEADWDRVLGVNVKGTLFMCQSVIPHMVRRAAGSVVNIASDSAFDVIPGEGAYGISKIAVVRLSAYLARETAGTGVRVNALAPGWVRTRATEFVTGDPVAAAQALEGIPARRFAEPDDIAGAVLFLASGLANYVNGHCIVADGGRIAGVPG